MRKRMLGEQMNELDDIGLQYCMQREFFYVIRYIIERITFDLEFYPVKHERQMHQIQLQEQRIHLPISTR